MSDAGRWESEGSRTRRKCGEAMTAITLESDSSHSPPGLNQSNERSSLNSPKTQQNGADRGEFCENSRRAWYNLPAVFLDRGLRAPANYLGKSTPATEKFPSTNLRSRA